MKIILTNMCMLYDGKGNILVQNRVKKDWPGINFPGGHVEVNEDTPNSVKREMKEETGLTVHHVVCCGAIEWCDRKNDLRHLCILYRSHDYSGELISSSEGEMIWIKINDVNQYTLSLDFDKVLEKCLLGLNNSDLGIN